MCKQTTITLDGPNADEFRSIIAEALAKTKNTLVVRDKHAAGTLESIPSPLRVAVIGINTQTPTSEPEPASITIKTE